jgi:ATP-binding cassette, subfamily B (MDR/TAP), member 1
LSGLRISAALRFAYLKALFNQSVTTVDTVSPGVISTRITTNSNLIQLGISQQLTMFVQASALTIGLYVVSLIKSWQLTLVASCSLPFILVVYGTIIPFFFKHHAITIMHFEKASSLAFEVMSSIRIVVAFGAENRLTSRYDNFIEDARKAELKNAPLMGLLISPILFSTYSTFALAFWYGIKLVTQGNIGGIGAITV